MDNCNPMLHYGIMDVSWQASRLAREHFSRHRESLGKAGNGLVVREWQDVDVSIGLVIAS